MTRTGGIFVGVDGAWKETGALDWALDEAVRTGAWLHVVHVVDDSYGELPYLALETVQTHAEDLIAEVREHLETMAPVRVTADAVAGSPGVALTKAAENGRMLVVGRSGAGALSRLLLGSTAARAVATAVQPVVVVPDTWRPGERRDAPVVMGVDVAAPSTAALDFACTAAAERAVPLHLLACWDEPPGYIADLQPTTDELAQWRERTEHVLSDLVATWTDKHPEVALRAEARRGHPVAVLSEVAASSAQLVVVGGHRHGRWAALLGSVAYGVLAHAGCPLAIVHDDTPAS